MKETLVKVIKNILKSHSRHTSLERQYTRDKKQEQTF